MRYELKTKNHDLTTMYDLAAPILNQGYSILVKASNIETSDYVIFGVENCQDKEPEDDYTLQQAFETWDPDGQTLLTLLTLLAALPETYSIAIAIHAYED